MLTAPTWINPAYLFNILGIGFSYGPLSGEFGQTIEEILSAGDRVQRKIVMRITHRT
jgi:hypothetical protein